MTLAQLTYLVAVDTHRHFSRAAAHCHVSQPTLSTQIHKLEEELGVRLLDRSRQPVVPTEVGARLIEQARRVLTERDRLAALASEAQGRTAGTLRLGLIPTLAPYLIPRVAAPMAEHYPDVVLAIREIPTQPLRTALLSDDLDAGLFATDETSADLHVRALFTEPFVAYVGPDHRLAARTRIAPADLSLDDLWLLSEGHCFRDQVLNVCGERADAAGPHRTIRFESGNLDTLVQMVRHSGGMTLLPYLATRYLTDAERTRYVKPFTAPAPHRTIRLAYRRTHHKQHLLDAFVSVLRDVLPDTAEV